MRNTCLVPFRANYEVELWIGQSIMKAYGTNYELVDQSRSNPWKVRCRHLRVYLFEWK